MGFNNPGIEEGVRNVESSTTFKGRVGFNIGKNKDTPNERAVDDYLLCLKSAWPVADYIAVNLSSPNTPGLRALQDATAAAHLLERLQAERASLEAQTGRNVPLAIKVAPDLDDDEISALSKVFLDHSLDAIIATNTTINRADIKADPLAQEKGGLSGAPLGHRSTKVIESFHQAVGGKIPIIGVGGIMSPLDAQEKIEAGATLLQLYSGFIYHGPRLIREILCAGSEKPSRGET
jgi:dihydroorotate dehydrogenase